METTQPRSVDFHRKIKTLDELQSIVGGRPRKHTVVMCHGTFDIVHPGHLRHLMYAKERASILVAVVKPDAQILKSTLRPFVPQEVRAVNLAALEFVDFVILDQSDQPLDVIQNLQPDFFAKGFDYFEGPPSTAAKEIEAVEAYGGEMLFTPGDASYPVGAAAESSAPRLGVAQLVLLMESEGISFADLYNALGLFQGIRVHVVGDTIVDSYTYCRMQGGAAKTPTISVLHERQTDFAGGAAVVSRHMRSAGASVTFSTVLGNDELGEFVVKEIEDAGIVGSVVVDRTRPTTQKNSFIANGYHLLRVGKLDNRIISDKIQRTMLRAVAQTPADIVVFSDFRHGIFNRTTIPLFLKSVPEGVFKVADSQVSSRWGNILDFQGCDLITPNEREVRFALGDQDSVVRPLARELYSRAHCKCLMMTMGERGLLTYRRQSEDRAFFMVHSFADHVADAVGAGDALLSYASLALYTTKSEVIASILGSAAAAVACEREGTALVSPEDVKNKLLTIEKLIDQSKSYIDSVVAGI